MSIQIERVQTDKFSMKYFHFGKGKQPLVILPGLSVQSVIPSAAAIEQHYSIFEDEFTVYISHISFFCCISVHFESLLFF